ncbi:MAG: TetR/AcrR family transcriptional regulator [Ilumatobacteraceae bacterium]
MTVQRSVLDAALDIIATTGPEAVSMRDVARRAGVSHQAPYHHFTDRPGIFAAIATEGFTTLAAAFQSVLASDSHPSTRCFEAYVRMAREHPGHFRVMFRADLSGILTHPSTAAAADEAFNELLRMVERTIGRPSTERESFTWASLMWSTAHGFATLLIDGPLLCRLPEGVTVEQHITEVVELMSEMVERQATAMGLSPSLGR